MIRLAKIVPGALALLILAVLGEPSYAQPVVTGYALVQLYCSDGRTPDRLIALRRFSMNGRELYLVADRDTLKTRLEPVSNLLCNAGTAGSLPDDRVLSPYRAAVLSSTSPPYRLQNGGLRKFSGGDGAVLTVDLCPSKRPLSRDLFTGMFRVFGDSHKPLPVAIAVSGKWIENHGADIRWLQSLESKNQLSITWINHSYSHPRTYPKSPLTLSKGFLLTKDVDMAREVLKAEELMIEYGMVPSVFFRFPGLVSSGTLMETIRNYGLIALGSDAWLAKREWPGKGSIILVHANGHEPEGIRRFFAFLLKMKSAITRGEWKLLDLKDCAAREFRVPRV